MQVHSFATQQAAQNIAQTPGVKSPAAKGAVADFMDFILSLGLETVPGETPLSHKGDALKNPALSLITEAEISGEEKNADFDSALDSANENNNLILASLTEGGAEASATQEEAEETVSSEDREAARYLLSAIFSSDKIDQKTKDLIADLSPADRIALQEKLAAALSAAGTDTDRFSVGFTVLAQAMNLPQGFGDYIAGMNANGKIMTSAPSVNDLMSARLLSDELTAKVLAKEIEAARAAGTEKPVNADSSAKNNTPIIAARFESLLTLSGSASDLSGANLLLTAPADDFAGLTAAQSWAPAAAAGQTAALPHAHPATQAVAVHIRKLASGGETRNLTIQLDPPDLGKVQIRMEFTKNKAVKAVVTSEKPETHLLLQKDAQLLERALQSAGLEQSDGGLSFELADEQSFQQDGRHDGSRNAARAGEAEDGEIIETTMSWAIDPASGHMRYSILA